MKAKELRKKNNIELNTQLLSLLRKQFSLFMRDTNERLQRTHILKYTRRDIARIKTIIAEKVNNNEQ